MSIKKILDKFILFLTSVIMAGLVFGAVWQVFSRYILGDPSTFTEELLRFLLIWVSMLGAAYAFGHDKHLALVFLIERMKKKSPSNARILIFIVDVITLLFAGVILIFGGLRVSTTTMKQLSPILGIPMGVVYSILPITGVLIFLYKFLALLEKKSAK